MDDIYSSLFKKLSKLQWLMHRMHLQNHAEHGPMADPTRGQGRVLAALKLKSEISTKELSYLLAIRQQSLNELLNKLERGGYVTRTPSDADKRIMMVGLTEKGQNEQPNVDFSSIFECLNEDEQRNFAEYLERVIKAMESMSYDGNEYESEHMHCNNHRHELNGHRCGHEHHGREHRAHHSRKHHGHGACGHAHRHAEFSLHDFDKPCFADFNHDHCDEQNC